VLGRHFSQRPGIVGLAQQHSSPVDPCPPVMRSGAADVASQAAYVQPARWGLHRGAMQVASGKVGRWGSHRRRPAAVRRRKRPGVAALQGGGGAPVAGEGVDESYSWRRGRGR
jgi:hypothetical protein